jgi:hypothetical protein
MLKNTFKTLFFLCSLSGIAHIGHGMEMEPEPKKLKTDDDLGAQIFEKVRSDIAGSVLAADLTALKQNLKLVPFKFLKFLLNEFLYIKDEKGCSYLPLWFAVKGVMDSAPGKRDMYYPIVEELLKNGADINSACKYIRHDCKFFCQKPFLDKAISKRDLRLIEFLLKNGADPDQTGKFPGASINSPFTTISASERVQNEIVELENRLNHGVGGTKKTPIKTPKIRNKIEKEINEWKEIQKLLQYYKDHYSEFKEQREKLFEEGVRLGELRQLQKDLKQKEAVRIQSQQSLRPQCFEIDFLMSLGRK